MNENLIYDRPQSQGAENVLRRAHDLLDLKWTPARGLAVVKRNLIGTVHGPADGTSYTGTPYSSTRVLDRFLGIDISLDTFLTALSNPASVLYSRDLTDFYEYGFHPLVTNASLFYGTVCSAFVNYSIGLPLHRSTHEWDIAPELFLVENQSADGLQLCDTLVTTRPNGRSGGHVRLVTGLGRDRDGHVREVEISEGVMPLTVCRSYTAEQFEATLTDPNNMYKIYRYRDLDKVVYEAPRFKNEDIYNDMLMPDFGDCANYRLGETVELNLFKGSTLTIEGSNYARHVDIAELAKTELEGESYTIYRAEGLPAGKYSARCDGGKAVHFTVAKTCDVSLTYADGQPLERKVFYLRDPDGNKLTKASPCFRDANGNLLSSGSLLVTDGERSIPVTAAFRADGDDVLIRTSVQFSDENGKRLGPIKAGCETPLYVLTAPEGAQLRASFSGAEYCTPRYYSFKDQRYASYDQRMLSEKELADGAVTVTLKRHDTDVTNFMIFCGNENGRIASVPFALVILD